jgi:hypothetical protein
MATEILIQTDTDGMRRVLLRKEDTRGTLVS